MLVSVKLIDVLNGLLQAGNTDQDAAIDDILGWLCENVPVACAVLFQSGTANAFSRAYSSYASKTKSAHQPDQAHSPDASAQLVGDWPAGIQNFEALAGIAPELGSLRREMGQLVVTPMRQDGQLAGFICFGVAGLNPAAYDESVMLLISITDLIGSVLARRAIEKQNVEAASRLEATLAALPNLLFEMDADGRYTGFTAGPEHLMAADRGTLAGKSMDAVLPPDVADIAMAALREVFATGSTRDIHYRLDLEDGPHDFELTGALKSSPDAKGRPSAIFLVRDVTRDAQLREELQRLGKIIEVMDNLVIITDEAQCVVWANAAFERHTGWRLDEIRGRALGNLLRCAESDPATIEQVSLAIAQRRPFKGEMINQDRHGNRYWVDFNILPLIDAGGQLQGYVSIETVVSHIKEQEAAMANLAAKAAAAQTRLENALMALPDGVVVLDADERVIAVTAAYRKTFPALADIAVPGVTLTELLKAGLSRGLFANNSGSEDPDEVLQNRLAQYRQPQFVDEVQLPDGRWLRRINMRTSDGGCIAVGIEITARKRHLAALDAVNQDLMTALEDRDAARQRLLRIMDGADIGTWEWDIVSDSLKVGGRWGEIIGLETRSMAVLRTVEFRAFVHPDDLREMDRNRDADLAKENEIIELEFRMMHSDGHWVWILSRSRVTERDANGAPRVVVGVHIDISERKRLEHELVANRLYLSQIMDTSVAAVAVLSGAGVITFANLEAERVLGLERSHIVGREHRDPAWRIERVEGGPIPDDELPFRQAILTGGPVRDIKLAIHWPSGIRRILSVNAVPLNLGEDENQVVASFSDITEQVAATTRLEEALSRAEEMSRAKSTFLANMSHEIRTPLNGVLGMAEVLDSLLTEPSQKRMIETIRKSGDTLLTVLNGILDMSKIEAGKMELEEVAFSPMEIARQVKAIYTIQAEEKGIEFEILSSAGCERPRLGDPHRIHQILNNLLNNAMKFTERGNVQLKLSCRPGKPVQIEVSDTGIGMDAQQVSRAFESFEQADGSTTRRFGGTGLGLSIVRQLVKLMRGEITLDSEVGRGTRIRITLPLAEGLSTAPAPRVLADARAKAGSLSGVRLLCADDNQVNLLVLKEMLSSTGAIITEVENGQQAVEAWASSLEREEPFAVLLLDIAMPVRDGMSALAEIRAAEETRGLNRVPAIAVTANAMAHQVADYIIGGFDTHLAKPFKQADLTHALHTLL